MNRDGETTVLERPAFVIGVTGNLDPQVGSAVGLNELKGRLRSVFGFLRGRTEEESCEGRMRVEEMLGAGLETVGLEHWKGAGRETPVVLLSSLAPGIDQIAVEVALEMGIAVKCPLPFPAGQYARSDRFTRKGDGEEANAKRVGGFNKLRERLGEGDVFSVELARDREVGDGAPRLRADELKWLREQQLEQEATGEDAAGRMERYRAAGEYVAMGCDVLVAVYDAEDAPVADAELGRSPRAAAIVEAKRRGVTEGLLAGSGGVVWASNGPVLHLHQAREAKAEGRLQEKDSRRAGRRLRVLYPYRSRREGEVAPVPAPWEWGDTRPRGDDLKWARRCGEQLAGKVANLRAFNRAVEVDEVGSEQALRKLLATGGKKGKEEVSLLEHAAALADLARVQRVAASGRTAEAGEERLLEKGGVLVGRLFFLAVAGALLLGVFAHWRADEGGASSGWVRVGAGLLAAVVAAVGVVLLGRQKLARVEERASDYRSLAECLRVQFYWGLSGLWQAVAAHTKPFERAEPHWVRGAVGSMAFPNEQWRTRFAGLAVAERLAVLKRVKEAWVDAQASGFLSWARERRQALKVAQARGCTLGLAGLMHLAALLWLIATDGGQRLAARPAVNGVIAEWVYGSVVVLAALVALRFAVLRKRAVREFWDVRGTVMKLLPAAFVEWWGEQLGRGAGADGRAERRRRLGLVMGVVWCLPLAVALTGVSAGIVLWLAPFKGFPDVTDLGLMMMVVFSVAGGLTYTRAERERLLERAYRPAASAAFFAHAGSRLGTLLERMEIEAHGGGDCGAVTAQVQELLYAVGRESLEASAEWALSRRPRPEEV